MYPLQIDTKFATSGVHSGYHVSDVMKRNGLAAAAICVSLVGACKSGPQDLESGLQQLVDSGYVSERRYPTTALHEVWERDDIKLDVSFIAPAVRDEVRFPVIVYLPGLGESSAAGILWRKAWAQSGYAVLAIQPDALTEQVWASRRAREGDFRALAKEHFSTASAAARVRDLDFALRELKRRASTGNSPYGIADTSNVVLSGFDIGARTASLVSGENADGRELRTTGATIRAVIVLSPFFEGTAANAEERFSAMALPVLSITGTADADPFSLVQAPSLRQVPWSAMPAGDKYLLVIRGGTHAVLAGDGFYEPGSAREASRPGNEDAGQNPSGRGRGRRGGGQESDGASASGTDPEKGADSRRNAKRGKADTGPQSFSPRHIAAIRDVSTAFLDATVKAKTDARKWLAENATRWLGDAAVLKSR
jgi:predicted dienelactone hydrolase